MPQGVHKTKRPSGCQQRKAKKAKIKALEACAGSMLQYIKTPNDFDQSSSKGTAHDSSSVETDLSYVTIHSDKEKEMEIAEVEADRQEKMGEFEAEEHIKSNSSHDFLSEYDINDIQERNLQILRNVSFWKIPVPDHFRVSIIKKGSAAFQNKDEPFNAITRQDEKAKGKERQFSTQWFFKMMPDGEKILRSWMVYSLSSGMLYCFCCRLFTVCVTDATSKFVTGFQNWWKLNPKVQKHETSEEHLCCLEKWKTLTAGLRLSKTIDTETIALMEMEKKKWRDILKRLLDITLFLAKQNLAFRGHKEDKSSLNKGNFLEMVEMLSKYDAVLKEHLMRLKRTTCKVKMAATYLSATTQNEFINVLANHVKGKLPSKHCYINVILMQ